MERDAKKVSYQSQSILGQIYRKVDIKQIVNDTLNDEFQTYILKKYPINRFIITKCKKFINYLPEVYTRIYLPFLDFMRKLMIENAIIYEVELFVKCSNYTYSSGFAQKYLVDQSKRTEDQMERIKKLIEQRLYKLNKEFKDIAKVEANYHSVA